MKVFLAFLVGGVVMFFVLRGQPAIERTPDDAPAVKSVAPSDRAADSRPSAALPSTTYKALLQPVYTALMDCTEKATDLKDMEPELTSLRGMLASGPNTPERATALRFCAIVEQAAILTRNMAERANRPSPRSAPAAGVDRERAEKEADSKDAFFRNAVESQWRSQIAPMQAAARNEWAQIPDGVVFSSPDLPRLMEARALRQRIAAAVPIYFSVVQVVSGGVLARPYEEYAIASSSARLGMGGNVGTGYRPGSKTLFIAGFPNATEGLNATVLAYRDGTFKYTDVMRAPRTVEKWVYVKNVR